MNDCGTTGVRGGRQRRWGRLWAVGAVVWGLATLASGLTLVDTPESTLDRAQRLYERGTNCLAKGMFREADSFLRRADGAASGRVRELDFRLGTLDTMKELSGQIQEAKNLFETDWKNAAESLAGIREPLLEIRDAIELHEDDEWLWRGETGLSMMRTSLERAVQHLDWLAEYAEKEDWSEAAIELGPIQNEISRQFADFEKLQPFGERFRAVAADTARAQEDLEKALAQPLEVARALAIAVEYREGAAGKIAAGKCWEGCNDIQAARTYLDDVRRSGEFAVETDAEEKTLQALAREFRLCIVRSSFDKAHWMLEAGQPGRATDQVKYAEKFFFPGTDDPAYAETVREATELKTAAERLEADQDENQRRTTLAAIRASIGNPDAPVLGQQVFEPANSSPEGRKRFAAETDFAEILREEMEDALRYDWSVTQAGDEDYYAFFRETLPWERMRSAFLSAENAVFPPEFPDGRHFSIRFVSIGEVPWRARTVHGADGTEREEIVPWLRCVEVVCSPAFDDAFVYFAGDVRGLFVAGGRTARLPGLGKALLERCPHVPCDERGMPHERIRYCE